MIKPYYDEPYGRDCGGTRIVSYTYDVDDKDDRRILNIFDIVLELYKEYKSELESLDKSVSWLEDKVKILEDLCYNKIP